MSEDGDVVTKLAIRTVLKRETPEGTETRVVFDVEAPAGSLHNGEKVTREVIGYVEHPPYQTVARQDHFGAFADAVQEQASDHYWFEDRLAHSERTHIGGDRDV